ncbi:MAG: GDSL-type esterase/lipase family protein [Acidimicrobiales bacterium]
MNRSIVAPATAMVAVGTVLSLALVSPSVSQAAGPPRPYYLSLGDSYSIGYQPGIGGTSGYTGYVAGKLNLQPENFGCGGATTSSLVGTKGCGDPASQDAVHYTGITQERAALNFIAAHKGAVHLVTISIGGNDFDGCTTVPCVKSAMPPMEAGVKSLVGSVERALVSASDTGARIIGLTYPDVDLGLYVYPHNPPASAAVSLAKSSILAFDDLINPTLKKSYLSVSGTSFVDVTSAPYMKATRGDDTSLSLIEELAPYGTVPVAVGEVCQLTYFCSQGNIHADTAGYTFIGSLVVAQYRSLARTAH